MDTGANPTEVVLSFLNNMPSTIATSLQALILLYADIKQPANPEHFLSVLGLSLKTGDGFVRTGRLVAMIAYIDQIFADWISTIPIREATANILAVRDPENPEWAEQKAMLPARNKHIRQANEQWQGLRQAALTHTAVHAYSAGLYKRGI